MQRLHGFFFSKDWSSGGRGDIASGGGIDGSNAKSESHMGMSPSTCGITELRASEPPFASPILPGMLSDCWHCFLRSAGRAGGDGLVNIPAQPPPTSAASFLAAACVRHSVAAAAAFETAAVGRAALTGGATGAATAV